MGEMKSHGVYILGRLSVSSSERERGGARGREGEVDAGRERRGSLPPPGRRQRAIAATAAYSGLRHQGG